MKLVLLASGRIAENIIQSPSLFPKIKRNLVGVVAPDNILELLGYLKNVRSLPLNVNEKQETKLTDLIENTNPDYILSIQYPWILSQNLIDFMSGRILNLHNAKLPDFRGHNSFSHEILNHETSHTTTLHWISAEVDRGRIVFTKEIDIFEDDTAFSLWKRSIGSCHSVLDEWFEYLEVNKRFPQGKPVPGGGFYFRKDISSLKKIPDGATQDMIDRWSRAFWFPPHEPAYMKFKENCFYVLPNSWIYKDL